MVLVNFSLFVVDTSPSISPLDSSAPLAALAVLVLLIPLLYPLGVLIAYLVFFKDKSEILVHLYVSLFDNEWHNNEYCVGTHFTLVFPVYLQATVKYSGAASVAGKVRFRFMIFEAVYSVVPRVRCTLPVLQFVHQYLWS